MLLKFWVRSGKRFYHVIRHVGREILVAWIHCERETHIAKKHWAMLLRYSLCILKLQPKSLPCNFFSMAWCTSHYAFLPFDQAVLSWSHALRKTLIYSFGSWRSTFASGNSEKTHQADRCISSERKISVIGKPEMFHAILSLHLVSV